MLREYQSAIGDNVEDADPACGELGLHSQLLRDFGRQTGGLRQIVSAAAVSDGNAHGRFPDSASEVYVNWRAEGSWLNRARAPATSCARPLALQHYGTNPVWSPNFDPVTNPFRFLNVELTYVKALC